MVLIRTDCSICQCVGPLVASRVWCPHTRSPALWHFLSSMRLHRRKRMSASSSLRLHKTKRPLTGFLWCRDKKFPKVVQQTVFSKREQTAASIFRWPVNHLLFLSAACVRLADLCPARFLLNFRKGQRAQSVPKYVSWISSISGWEFITCGGCRLAGSQPTHGGGRYMFPDTEKTAPQPKPNTGQRIGAWGVRRGMGRSDS